MTTKKRLLVSTAATAMLAALACIATTESSYESDQVNAFYADETAKRQLIDADYDDDIKLELESAIARVEGQRSTYGDAKTNLILQHLGEVKVSMTNLQPQFRKEKAGNGKDMAFETATAGTTDEPRVHLDS